MKTNKDMEVIKDSRTTDHSGMIGEAAKEATVNLGVEEERITLDTTIMIEATTRVNTTNTEQQTVIGRTIIEKQANTIVQEVVTIIGGMTDM